MRMLSRKICTMYATYNPQIEHHSPLFTSEKSAGRSRPDLQKMSGKVTQRIWFTPIKRSSDISAVLLTFL